VHQEHAIEAVESPSPANVGIAVVTFNPIENFTECCPLIFTDVENSLVIDNSDTKRGRAVSAHAAQACGAERIENPFNRGLGVAINQAIEWAAERCLPWLLLLDQDTAIVQKEILPRYNFTFENANDNDRLGGIGLVSRAAQIADGGDADTDMLITSGSLFRVAALQDCGGAWEDLFIDGIDTELCIRLLSHGWQLKAIKHPGIEHRIGEEKPVKIFSRTLFCNNHQPVRRYYSVRNRVMIARRHQRKIGWYLCLREDFLSPLFETDTMAKLAASLLGLFHGFRGILGPAPNKYFQ
jgi:rhamnosyltransferase